MGPLAVSARARARVECLATCCLQHAGSAKEVSVERYQNPLRVAGEQYSDLFLVSV